MSQSKKVFLSIYCKIYTDSFSNEMESRMATGQEIYDFLMRDAQHCHDDEGKVIPGDLNLWYLGCNEKFGLLKYQDKTWSWSFRESSFDRVEEFIRVVYKDGHFTKEQFETLMDKIQEGRLIDNMYDIREYLISKTEGRSWSKTEGAYRFRDEMKQFVSAVEGYFQGKGYCVLTHKT